MCVTGGARCDLPVGHRQEMTNEIESEVRVILVNGVQSVEFGPKGHKNHKQFHRKPTRNEHNYDQNQHFEHLLDIKCIINVNGYVNRVLK